MTEVRVGDVVKFKYHGSDGGGVLFGRVSSTGTAYGKPFNTKCDSMYFVKVLGYSREFNVKPEDIVEVFITPEVVQFS